MDKDDIVFRLIQNLKVLNAMMLRPLDMELDAIHAYIFEILSMDWVVQRDAKAYYFQFLVDKYVSLFLEYSLLDRGGQSRPEESRKAR